MTEFQAPEPQAQYEEVYVEVPQWPKVVGILSIVWASLGMTCGLCGIAGLVAAPMMMPPEAAKDLPPTMHMGIGQAVHMFAGISHGVLLLVAGILTLRRSMTGRMLHLIYGLTSFVLLAFGVWLNLKLQAETKDWAVQNPDNPMAKAMSQPGSELGNTIAVGAMIVFGTIWPLFCLVWFGLVKRTNESMTGMPEIDPMASSR
jgi:hypothetical protein